MWRFPNPLPFVELLQKPDSDAFPAQDHSVGTVAQHPRSHRLCVAVGEERNSTVTLLAGLGLEQFRDEWCYLNIVHSTLSNGNDAAARLMPLISPYADPARYLITLMPNHHLSVPRSSDTW